MQCISDSKEFITENMNKKLNLRLKNKTNGAKMSGNQNIIPLDAQNSSNIHIEVGLVSK